MAFQSCMQCSLKQPTEILNYEGVGRELDNVEGRKLFDGAFVKKF